MCREKKNLENATVYICFLWKYRILSPNILSHAVLYALWSCLEQTALPHALGQGARMSGGGGGM